MQMHWDKCSTDVFDSTGKVVVGSAATLGCIPLLIQVVIYWAIFFAGILAIFIIIYGGYKYINSGGDPKQADTARKTLIYAIFGLLLIFMSFFIVSAIGQIAGLNQNCYSLFGFTNCH